MKTSFRILGSAALFCVLPLTARLAQAQSTVETSSVTTSIGTISEFTPETITVRSESAATPMAYRYTKSTTYVDEAGAPVAVETIRSGAPVTVYYVKEGDGMVASKVIVRKIATTPVVPVTTSVQVAPVVAPVIEEKKTTTTTTTTD